VLQVSSEAMGIAVLTPRTYLLGKLLGDLWVMRDEKCVAALGCDVRKGRIGDGNAVVRAAHKRPPSKQWSSPHLVPRPSLKISSAYGGMCFRLTRPE
jgi:hypothetical protein